MTHLMSHELILTFMTRGGAQLGGGGAESGDRVFEFEIMKRYRFARVYAPEGTLT